MLSYAFCSNAAVVALYAEKSDTLPKSYLWLYDNHRFVLTRLKTRDNIIMQIETAGFYLKIGNKLLLKNKRGSHLLCAKKANINSDRITLTYKHGKQNKVYYALQWNREAIYINRKQIIDSILAVYQNLIDDKLSQSFNKSTLNILSLNMKYAEKQKGSSCFSNDSLKKMKTVIIVGSRLDSNSDYLFSKEAQDVKQYLELLHIPTVLLQGNDASWESVINAAEHASIFIYMGHGLFDIKSNQPGGLVLADGSYTSEFVMKQLKLNKGAVVFMSHVCFAAGVSASDNKPVDSNLAKQRVIQFADPYLKNGAMLFYANNYFGSMIKFLSSYITDGFSNSICREGLDVQSSFTKDGQEYGYLLLKDEMKDTGKDIRNTRNAACIVRND